MWCPHRDHGELIVKVVAVLNLITGSWRETDPVPGTVFVLAAIIACGASITALLATHA
jgi:hypothetical protein